MELLQKLEHPEKEYTPIPFWFLNGDLSEEELQRQLEDFAVHGVYGVVLHPRMGLLFLLYSCNSEKSSRIGNESSAV